MMERLRSGVFAAWFYGLTFAFGFAGVFVRMLAPGRTLAVARRWARTVLGGLPVICGIRIVVTGLERIPADGPIILASQHQSAFDTLVWMMLLDRPSYIMKEELRRIPLFGPMLEPSGMIPVDRAAGAAAMRGLINASVRAKAASRQIVIFPEGTRIPPGTRVKLHPGVAAIAKRTGVAVLPVATDSGLCWPRELWGKRPGTIHVIVGPPLARQGRDELLAAIEGYWRRAETDGFSSDDACG